MSDLFETAAHPGSGSEQEVRSRETGEPIGKVQWLDRSDIDEVFSQTEAAGSALSSLPTWRRAEILYDAGRRLLAEQEKIARLIVHETRKTITEARDEVRRASDVLAFSAAEVRKLRGEYIDFEAQYRGEGVVGWSERFPVGVIVAATPFNSPLNLAAHKIGPAFAMGNPVVLKPSPKAILSGVPIINALLAAGAPKGSVGFAPVPNELAIDLFGHAAVDLVSFTGQAAVGWQLRRSLADKRFALELGSNGSCLVAADANIPQAAQACVTGAMAAAGQVCASIQRVFVDEQVANDFAKEAAGVASSMEMGDPFEEATDVGPMLDTTSAERIVGLIEQAVNDGAEVLCGGERRGDFVAPCVLDNVSDTMSVACDEAFGPVMGILRVTGVDEGIRRANASPYGLQASVFTRDIATAIECFHQLEAGTVIVNRHHAWRVDHMPFGGWKESGFGREGVREAMMEFSQSKVFALDWRAGL